MKRKSFVGEPINGNIFINPGTGPVEDADVGHARQNISQLIVDAGFELEEVTVTRNKDRDRDGRFSFDLQREEFTCNVDMPGLDISEVRYMSGQNQNPWNYPRLYVDGSSWLWVFAIESVQRELNGEHD